ncbi:MAG: hypothetical protein FWF22_04595, partial [Treponema sp.]|nr:hypothetical protein [Treponema sp.]
MTVSQKAALSLLVSVLLFAGFSVLAFTGLFNLIETKFYDPSITSSLNTELNHNAASVESFLNSQMARFSAALAEPSVRRSFLSNQTSDDIYERTKIFGAIQESIAGFQWARFIDSEGIRLNYSTYPSDILNQDSTFVAYRNYPGLSGALPYDTIASQDGDKGRIIFDQEGDRILISLPFYDFYEVYRGTALFSLSVRALSEQLINEGSIKAGDDVSVISDPQGVLIGRPAAAGKTLFPQVASVWNSGVLNLTAIEPVASSPQDSAVGLNTLALLSVKTNQGLFVGRLINEDVFSFPMPMKIILLISFFLTVYLIFFLLLNLRQDSVTIVQNRLKQLQISLIEQFYERKAAMDWSRWGLELEQRREEIRSELKKGIKDKTKNGESKNDIDQLIDKSWDELLAVIGGRRETSIDEEKLQLVLNRIMSAPQAEGNRPAVPAPQAESKSNEAELQPVDDAEELEELEEVESDEAAPVEELTELESANAEPVETLTELESADAEPVEAETLEELQEVESADAEPVETLTELESADAEPVETLTELESADAEPVETLT